ncbi:putative Acid phosphatase, Peroxidase [Helianthus annuus]|nr:putative Acid phosphatase, Peroxidase [Helianthus annuus]
MATKFHIVIHLLVYVMTVVVMVAAELQRFQHPVKADGSLRFLAIGDWGRRGLYNQSNVAYQVTLITLWNTTSFIYFFISTL